MRHKLSESSRSLKILFNAVPLLLLVNLTFIYLIPQPVKAQYLTGPVAMSLGGAGVAAAEPAEGLFMNPATVVHGPDFSMTAFYQDGYLAQVDHETNLSITLADNSKSLLFPGGLAYAQKKRTFVDQQSVNESYWQVSVAQKILKHWAVGLSVQRLETKVERGGSTHIQWNSSVGLHYNPHPDWGFGLVYRDFAGASSEIPLHLWLIPKTSLGMNWIVTDFLRVRMDIGRYERFNPGEKIDIGGGFQSYISQFLIVAIGYESQSWLDRKYITAGFSFNGPRFKLDYSIKKNQDGSDGAMHSVDIRAPF